MKSYSIIIKVVLCACFICGTAVDSITFAADVHSIQSENVCSGRVTDKNGAPIVGATVYVESTHNVSTSDSDGRFYLNDVKSGQEIIVSLLGYETQKVIYRGADIEVMLEEDTLLLDDVLCVGYGNIRKEDLTSAITKVDEKSFNSGVVNPINLIQGKIPGLVIRNTAGSDPNASPDIQLRGVGSIRAGSAPLIIIDGVYSTTTELNSISSSDIKSFNVLKDGSSAAIYGTRGSNGVIIVETKSGVDQKSTIEYNSYYYFERPTRQLEVLSAQEYMDVLGKKGLSQVDNEYGFSTDWQDNLIRNNFSYFQGLSFATSSENSSIRASVGYRDSESMVINTGNDQLNGRINFKQYFFNKRLTIDGTASGAITNSNYTDYGAFMQAVVYNPTAPVRDGHGKFFEFEGVGPYNPVALLSEVDNRGKLYNYNVGLTATLEILPSLRWTVMASTNNENYESTKYIDKDSRYSKLSELDGEATVGSHFYQTNTIETYGTYNLDKKGHSFSAMLGYSYSEIHRVWSSFKNSGFMTDMLGVNNIGNGSGIDNGLATMGRGEDRSKLIAFFGRLNYSYKGKYIINASLRREGSTRFGENNKWGWFPAVSAAWNISKEGFMENVSSVNNLKIRAGYGLTGNQDIPLYSSISKFNDLGNAYYNGKWQSVYGPTTNSNPNLRWEKNTEFNLGVDLGLWQDRLSISVDGYYRKTTDLLEWYSAQTPSSIYSTIFTNVGSLSNTGVEFYIGADILRSGDFNWHVDVTASYNKNMLLSLSNDTYKANHIEYNTLSSPANGQNTYIFEKGMPIGTYYGYKYKGLTSDGKWIFEDIYEDGEINENDYTYLGCGSPSWNYSLSSTFTWKNLDFSFQFRGAADFLVLNTKRLYYENTVSLPFNLLRSAYDTKVNDAATFSDFYLEPGDYLKLSNITLGYNINFPKAKFIDNIRVYATATNLCTITGYSGVDPEVGSGLTPGFDDSNYFPRSCSYIFGLNIKF